MRGIHTPDNIQNGGHPGGECLSYTHWLGPWCQHFDDESWRGSGYAFMAESTSCVSLFCAVRLKNFRGGRGIGSTTTAAVKSSINLEISGTVVIGRCIV
jgi:hypothetical protein